MKKFYITTPIYYVNDEPHIGHVYTTTIADIIAREKRKLGYDVLFSTGTDENASKVKKVAQEKGVDTKLFVDSLSESFRRVFNEFNISYDTFIRTTEKRHERVVQYFFNKLKENGYIYKGIYEGWYCIFDETFFSQDEIKEGNLCPVCGRPLEYIKEEDYFFSLSKFQDTLLKHYLENPKFVEPESRYNEMLSLIKSGLKDISITRRGIGWGIPVPQEENLTIYVWFDALINYVTVTSFLENEEKFNKYWPADLHLIGKDITRFHTIIWPAMLLGVGLSLPKKIYAHGFWLSHGEKMSKSKGNFIKPDEVIRWFIEKSKVDKDTAVDVFRYYILRDMTFGEDGNFSYDSYITRYNSELANDLGNLLYRTLNMGFKYFNGKLSGNYDNEIHELFSKEFDEVISLYENLKLSDVPIRINSLANVLNKYIDTKAPWNLYKENKDECDKVLSTVFHGIYTIINLISPILISSSKKFFYALGKDEDGTLLKEKIFPWKGEFNLREVSPIFPRVEEEKEKVEVKENYITIEDFQKLDLRVAEIIEAKRVKDSKKLIEIKIKIENEIRTIVAGIGEHYRDEELIGKKIIVLKNLEPKKLKGILSEGMLLAASKDGKLSLLTVDKDVDTGAKIS
ncbi:MAG: methionine--tRNA ligase [Caldisericia bacterium]|jgi:methionyl-tRNA synthetase|nr:methionine--tRNA ligase [Caldisericia bacterium]